MGFGQARHAFSDARQEEGNSRLHRQPKLAKRKPGPANGSQYSSALKSAYAWLSICVSSWLRFRLVGWSHSLISRCQDACIFHVVPKCLSIKRIQSRESTPWPHLTLSSEVTQEGVAIEDGGVAWQGFGLLSRLGVRHYALERMCSAFKIALIAFSSQDLNQS